MFRQYDSGLPALAQGFTFGMIQKVAKRSLPFCHRHKKEAKKARQNDASPRSSQSGNRLTKLAEVDNFVVDYPDCAFTPVRGPPILSGHRSFATAFFLIIMFVVFYE